MPCAVIMLEQALVTRLNAQVFDPQFTAVRRVVVERELKESDDLMVSVFPFTIERSMDNRGENLNVVKVNIAFQKKLKGVGDTGEIDVGDVDDLRNLVSDVADWLMEDEQDMIGDPEFGREPGEGFVEVNPYNERALRELMEFRSVITVTYSMVKSR